MGSLFINLVVTFRRDVSIIDTSFDARLCLKIPTSSFGKECVF